MSCLHYTRENQRVVKGENFLFSVAYMSVNVEE